MVVGDWWSEPRRSEADLAVIWAMVEAGFNDTMITPALEREARMAEGSSLSADLAGLEMASRGKLAWRHRTSPARWLAHA